MTDQLAQWSGELGNRYTQRNLLETNSAVPYFAEALRLLDTHCHRNQVHRIKNILEVGCNLGGKLASMLKAMAQVWPDITLGELMSGEYSITGIEPNEKARAAAWQLPLVNVVGGNAYSLPFEDDSVDLVFTSGVLIHIPPEKIAEAIHEIHRVARYGVLAIEYYAATEENTGTFDGMADMLWNRDYGSLYRDCFPDLSLLGEGPYREWYIPNCKWWLFGKAPK